MRTPHTFLIVALTSLVSTPIMLFGLYSFYEKLITEAIVVLVCIIAFGALFILIVIYRDKILNKLWGSARIELELLLDDMGDSVSHFSSGEYQEGVTKLKTSIRGWISRYSWLAGRQWILSVSVTLFLTFAALLGSVLLLKQNTILERQNVFFSRQNSIIKEQNKFLQQQLASDNIARNAQIVFGSLGEYSPARKAIAVKILVDALRSSGQKIDLSGADLRNTKLNDFDFTGADLRGVLFNGANLTGAKFNSTDLTNANFSPFTDSMNGWSSSINSDTSLIVTKVDNANLQNAILDGANFKSASMIGANLTDIKMKWVVGLSNNDDRYYDWWDETPKQLLLYTNSLLIDARMEERLKEELRRTAIVTLDGLKGVIRNGEGAKKDALTPDQSQDLLKYLCFVFYEKRKEYATGQCETLLSDLFDVISPDISGKTHNE
jgi:uncharacterized protein YjbI with pentapeptide repeats